MSSDNIKGRVNGSRESPNFCDNSSQKSSLQGTESSLTFSSLGSEGQTLLCSEPMLSSTPSSGESQDTDRPWKASDILYKNKKSVFSVVVGKDSSGLGGNVARDDKCDLIAAVSKFERNNNHLLKGPAPSDAERMNSNGFERGRLTGSGPSGSDPVTPWLPPDASGVNPSRTLSENPTSRSLGGQGSHAMIAGSPMGAIFRSPGEPPHRMYPVAGAGQFSPSHTSAGASTGIAGGPYSPHYSVYGQQSPLASQYGAYYQYPHVYSHSSPAMLSGGHYPEIQSYSAVLASMGSQVQQTSGQSRVPYVTGHLAQYGASSGHRSSLSSPGEEHLHPETKVSPKPETRETTVARETTIVRETTLAESGRLAASSKEGKYSSFPGHVRQSSSSHLRELSPIHDGGAGSKDTVYKVPCGKEGSLKHRILTRPPDIHIEDSTLVESMRHSSQRAGEPSSKRTKTYVQSPLATTTSAASRNPGSSSQQQQGANLAPSHLHYPPHFTKGSIIQLANGDLKRVEDLRTEDFVHSAEISSDLKIDSSTVVRIDENADRGTAVLSFRVGEHKVPVTVEAMVEHPFFVFGRCWSSCYPERTSQRYGLECQKLAVGDVCISLTHKDVTRQAAELSRSAEHAWSINTQGSKPQTAMHSQRNQPNSRHRGIAQSQSIDIVEVSSSRVNTFGSGDSVPQNNRLPRKRRWSAPDQASSESEGVNVASWTKPTNDNQKPSQSSA